MVKILNTEAGVEY